MATGASYQQLGQATSNYQQLPTYRRCVGWDVPKVSMELPRVVSPPQRVPRKHRDPNPKSPREPGLGFETLWEIPRNGWDVPDRKGWDPPADQPHTHTSHGRLESDLVLSGEADKNGEKGKMAGRGKRGKGEWEPTHASHIDFAKKKVGR